MMNEDDRELPNDQRIEVLMPWIKHGGLDEKDRALISDARTNLPEFQARLVQERDLGDALEAIARDENAAAGNSAQADAAWAKFKQRLATAKPAAVSQPGTTRLRAAGKARSSNWRLLRLPQTRMGWLAAGQTAALACVALLFASAQLSYGDAQYRTLSSAPSAPTPTGSAVVAFKPATDQAAMRAALVSAHARIVDGPMANGGYIIALGEERMDEGLETLRANDSVLLIEALGGGERQ